MEARAVTITIPRSILIAACFWCFSAGASVMQAATARENGYSPLWPTFAAVAMIGLAIQLVWEATRPQPVGPVPRADREPPVA
jgi:hypothetical protein